MIDLKWIRDNPALLDEALARRGLAPQSAEILSLDQEHRSKITALQSLQSRRNDLARAMGAASKTGQDTGKFVAEGAALKASIHTLEGEVQAVDQRLQALLCQLPNIPANDVPSGACEADNLEISTWGTPKKFEFTAQHHYDIGHHLGLMDFDAATRLAGSRFVVLRGALARLERALANFMLDIHTQEFGYEECYLPLLVSSNTMYGTAQLPKFESDFFQTTDGRWLIPTAEAPLTNLVANLIIPEDTLPRRYVAYTQCFRSEAGAAGKDTRGMLRQHQFGKVELVSITTPHDAPHELERMTQAAQTILQRLAIPYRTVTLCAGDLGGGAQKTYDLEVWLPGQGAYREISSCSSCGDYQARRMNARFRKADGKTHFVHTLNGSGVAVGRALIAVVENYQQADGSIAIPDVLRPYMGGLQRIDT